MRHQSLLGIVLVVIHLAQNASGQTVKGTYTPPFSPLSLAISHEGQISIEATASLVTPLGTFAIGADLPLSGSPPTTIVVAIRDRSKGLDDVFRISHDGQKLEVVTDGRSKVTIEKRLVIIDVTAAKVDRIQFWNTRQEGRLQQHKATVNLLRFSPNGQFLISSSKDCTLGCWNLETGVVYLIPTTQRMAAVDILFEPHHKYFFASFPAGFRSSSIDYRAYDPQTGEGLAHRIVDAFPDDLPVSGDSTVTQMAVLLQPFIEAQREGVALAPEMLERLREHPLIRVCEEEGVINVIDNVAFSDARLAFIKDDVLKAIDFHTDRSKTARLHSDYIHRSIHLSPDSATVVTVHFDAGSKLRKGVVSLWDAATLTERQSIKFRDEVATIAFHPGAALVAIASGNEIYLCRL